MRQALLDATALADSRLVVNCHYWLGRMHYGRGDPSSAVQEFETVLANAAHLNDDQLLGRAYSVLGRIALFTAEPRRGLHFLERGIDTLRRLDDVGEMIYSISSRACIHAFIGEFASRKTPLPKRCCWRDGTRIKPTRPWCCSSSATRDACAAAGAGRSRRQIVVSRSQRGAACRSSWLSPKSSMRMHASCRGSVRPATKDIVQAILGYQNTEYRLAGSLVHGWCAEICALHGDLTRAQAHADLSIGKDKVGDRFFQISGLSALARIAFQTNGLAKDGRELLAKAVELSEARGAMPDLGITHFYAAEFLADLQDRNGATLHRNKAKQLFSSAEMPWWEDRGRLRKRSTLIQFPKRA